MVIAICFIYWISFVQQLLFHFHFQIFMNEFNCTNIYIHTDTNCADFLIVFSGTQINSFGISMYVVYIVINKNCIWLHSIYCSINLKNNKIICFRIEKKNTFLFKKNWICEWNNDPFPIFSKVYIYKSEIYNFFFVVVNFYYLSSSFILTNEENVLNTEDMWVLYKLCRTIYIFLLEEII